MSDLRKVLLQEFENGATPIELIDKGYSSSTVYRWWNRWSRYKELEKELRGMVFGETWG